MQKKTGALMACMLCALLITGCSTLIDVDVTRPALLDIKDAKSICVLPFRTSIEMQNALTAEEYASFYVHGLDSLTSSAISASDEEAVASTLTQKLRAAFESKSHLTVLPFEKGKTAADVVLSGGIRYFGTQLNSSSKRIKNARGEAELIEAYWRDITVSIVYFVFDTKTDTVLADKEVKYTFSSDETTSPLLVPNAVAMLTPKLQMLSTDILRQFEPYTEAKALKLLFHKDTAMKTASIYAQNGDIETAIQKYRTLYTSRQIFEAGYNEAILIQSQGDLESARDRMEELFYRTDDKRAKEALLDIESEIAALKKLKEQTTY